MENLTLENEAPLPRLSLEVAANNLTFCLLGELEENTLHAFLEELNGSMDIGFDKLRDSFELIEVFQHKLAYWVVLSDNQAVGLFGISPSVTMPNCYQTSSLILKRFRGKGIGPLVKQTVAQSFLAHGLPLISCVRDWNAVSLRSMSRAFPEVIPELLLSAVIPEGHEPYYLYVYDLSKIAVAHVPEAAYGVRQALDEWVKSSGIIVVASLENL